MLVRIFPLGDCLIYSFILIVRWMSWLWNYSCGSSKCIAWTCIWIYRSLRHHWIICTRTLTRYNCTHVRWSESKRFVGIYPVSFISLTGYFDNCVPFYSYDNVENIRITLKSFSFDFVLAINTKALQWQSSCSKVTRWSLEEVVMARNLSEILPRVPRLSTP